jgi:glycosyltransferase involved in cell wall biosynthesis
MKKDLPRLLLVTEASLSQERTGHNRTLINLFEDYPKDRFMLYASDKSIKNNPPSPSFKDGVVSFKEQPISYISNRLGRFINPFLTIINHQIIDFFPLDNQNKIVDFKPEVILICPNASVDLIVGYKVTQLFDIPFLIYFMDDWGELWHTEWLTGNIQSIYKYILEKASGWLMISPELEKRKIERYKVFPLRSLIVHNPVDLSNKTFPKSISHTEKTFRVVYAGSIFAMHYDAIAVVAEAIYELRCSGVDIELVLYTDQSFWNNYQTSWQKWEVIYGSKIPYDQLNQYLQKAKLLLVASSFLPEMAGFTNSSVQTKLTDYMVSGTPILACGPTYSACNQFIKDWNCGLVCETNDVPVIQKLLLKQMQNSTELESLARNAFTVVSNHFEANKVRSNLYEFIRETTEHRLISNHNDI